MVQVAGSTTRSTQKEWLDIDGDSTSLALTEGGTGATSGAQAISNMLTDRKLLAKFNSRVASFKAGLTDLKFLLEGDSLMDGVQGSTRSQSLSRVLKNAIQTEYGLPASDDAWIGSGDDGNSGTARNIPDSRLVKGSSWSNDNATYKTVGGGTWTATTNTNSLAITPDIFSDTLTVYYIQNTSQGVFSLDYNGLGTVTQDSNGAAAIGTKVLTAAAGFNTYNIKWSSGGRVDIIGFYASLSTRKMAIIMNAGVGGSQSSAAADATQPWSYKNAIATINADMHAINHSTNDSTSGVALGLYESQMQAIITAALAVGDCMLVTAPPSNPADATHPKTYAFQQSYEDVKRQLAINNNILLLDIAAFYGTYEAAQALGYYFDTYVHQSTTGNAIIGSLIAKAAFSQVAGGRSASSLVQFGFDSMTDYRIGGNIIIPKGGTTTNTLFGVSANSGTVTTGVQNSGFGNSVMAALSTGINNTFYGFEAGKAINTSQSNTGMGYQVLKAANGAAANNTAFGILAGLLVTTGLSNCILGSRVGSTVLTTGSNNILIGTDNTVTTPASSTSNYLNIGNVIVGSHSTGTPDLLIAAPLRNYRLVEANVAGSGAPNVLLQAESGTVLTNEGATAKNYHTLPAADGKSSFEFYCQDSDGIRVVAAGANTIRNGVTASSAGGYAESVTVGSYITLQAINATEWVAKASVGTWVLA